MGADGVHTVNTTERLAKLRELMKQHSVQAFVVPSEDQRMDCDCLRELGFGTKLNL
jgi:hypothetical protein